MRHTMPYWILFAVCLAGAIGVGVTKHYGPTVAWPYQGLSVALGTISAAALLATTLSGRNRP